MPRSSSHSKRDLLTINAPGIKVKVAGTGSFRGQAYVSWDNLIGVANIPPTDDPVMIKVEAGRLIIGMTSMPCVWQESIADIIEMPDDAPLRAILELKKQYTEEQIARSGLIATLWKAEHRKYELISQAACLLEPFGIEYEDLLQFVEDALERLNRE